MNRLKWASRTPRNTVSNICLSFVNKFANHWVHWVLNWLSEVEEEFHHGVLTYARKRTLLLWFSLFCLTFIYIMQLLKRAPGPSYSTKNISVTTYIRCRERKKTESFPHYTGAYFLFLSSYQSLISHMEHWDKHSAHQEQSKSHLADSVSYLQRIRSSTSSISAQWSTVPVNTVVISAIIITR